MSQVDKTIGQLIDELSILNVKVYHLVDIIHDEGDDSKVAEAARKAQELNLQRSRLVNEIDRLLTGKEHSIKTR